MKKRPKDGTFVRCAQDQARTTIPPDMNDQGDVPIWAGLDPVDIEGDVHLWYRDKDGVMLRLCDGDAPEHAPHPLLPIIGDSVCNACIDTACVDLRNPNRRTVFPFTYQGLPATL